MDYKSKQLLTKVGKFLSGYTTSQAQIDLLNEISKTLEEDSKIKNGMLIAYEYCTEVAENGQFARRYVERFIGTETVAAVEYVNQLWLTIQSEKIRNSLNDSYNKHGSPSGATFNCLSIRILSVTTIREE